VLAFVIGVFGALRATQGSVAPELGVFFLLLAGACYWGAMWRFAEPSQTRNRRVAATWAVALSLAAAYMLFTQHVQVIFLCLAALLTAFVYTRTGKVSLGLHTSIFLAAAAAVSTLPQYIAGALAGVVPGAPDWGFWVTAGSAAACYGIGSRRMQDPRARRRLWVFPAILLGFAVAALGVAAIVEVTTGRLELTASRLAVIRTIVNCALALALAFLGSRSRRVELGWAAYAALAFGTLKLVFEDLRTGNAISLVFSLLFYGLVLILLPRLMNRGDSVMPDESTSSLVT
jgi:hypothetical protein